MRLHHRLLFQPFIQPFHSLYTMGIHKLLTVTTAGSPCYHTSTSSPEYENAVEKLNSLQSNAYVLEKIRQNRSACAEKNVQQTEQFLNKVGVKVEELDKLNVIHIGGTKGKGSTSAFCESLLRNHGYSTGFYSSPHLVAVRERIRLNGKCISEDKFTKYFWKIYNSLVSQKENEQDMPAYFKFLTVMAYYIFLKEKVDVAIVEVGIGGQYDCTNLIRKPVVCGVTSLGIDHVNTLGSTIDKIAWQKAGIFKPNVPAFTVSQPEEAMRVLHQRAEEVGCPLQVVPSLDAFLDDEALLRLNLSSEIQYLNASLALQLVNTWTIHHKLGKHNDNYSLESSKIKPPLTLNEKSVNGLKNCIWPGRCQTFRNGSVLYFLDGAHTIESIKVCVKWFGKASKDEERKISGSVFRVLIFNVFGDRTTENLLPSLISCNFNMVAFCPNFAHVSMNAASDQNAVASSWESQMERCTHHSHIWMRLAEEAQQKSNAKTSNPDPVIKTVLFPSICDVIKWLNQGRSLHEGIASLAKPDVAIPSLKSEELLSAEQVHVLVTGSLHLVGGFLSLLDPHLMDQDTPGGMDGVKSNVCLQNSTRFYSMTPGAP